MNDHSPRGTEAESREGTAVDVGLDDAMFHDDAERRLEAAARFPDQNPNPVLRMDDAGTLIYHNPASVPLVGGLHLEPGIALPDSVLTPLRKALDGPDGTSAEIEVGQQTYCLKPVASSEWGFVNIYATDVTAARAVERFPADNPNPVLRVADGGRLLYANPASMPIVEALGLTIEESLPAELWDRLCASAEAAASASAPGPSDASIEPIEVQGDAHWYELTCVHIPEFGFSNVYGRDNTALKALRRFPNQNPNPVMRVSQEGRLLFANPASDDLVSGLGLAVDGDLPDDLMARMRQEIAAGNGGFEVQADDRIYRLVVVSVFEFDFINVYGTDITAARQIEEAHAENERLLLNILPAPIAQRLRDGESVIADRHEDLSLLFADIVGFTQMSSNLPPEKVVDLLADLFRHLDELVDQYQLEKIKTIGDAYMVVGGLPPEIDDHLARVAAMALDLNEILTTRSAAHPITMRIGMHAGPAVAGVIGAKKFIYDVWGDTVNTASRLESNGLPSEIQVIDSVQARLDDRFLFESRGIVDLKGMGPTHTWFLRGRKGTSSVTNPGLNLA